MANPRTSGSGIGNRLRPLLPPVLFDQLRRWRAGRYGYHGDYTSWSKALADSDGYDAAVILSRVKEALRQVKNGTAAYERDAVAFAQPAVCWPLMACLLRVAAGKGNRLHVLDFGGSLGSLYFQHRRFLQPLTRLKWSVVEQPHFVACGRQHFADDCLRFFTHIADARSRSPVDLVLLSSVLPYLEKPFDLLAECHERRLGSVLIDRTPFLPESNQDRLTIQRVPPHIYPASYPAWFFSEARFRAFLHGRYRIVASFPGTDTANIPSVFKGWLLDAV